MGSIVLILSIIQWRLDSVHYIETITIHHANNMHIDGFTAGLLYRSKT